MTAIAAPAPSAAPADEMSPFAQTIYRDKYEMDGEGWPGTAARVVRHVLGALGYTPGSYEHDRLVELIARRQFMPGGRYLYASGREFHQTQNCLLLRAEDSREGWADLVHKSLMALSTGAGIGVDYSQVRPSGTPIGKTGGEASGPLSLMRIVNEQGRGVMQGGKRRSAIWAGLKWNHPDIKRFIVLKDWSDEDRARKERDYNFPLEMELTNISVQFDDAFFAAYENPEFDGEIIDWQGKPQRSAPDGGSWHDWAQSVYWETLERMVVSAEPGFSVDTGDGAADTLRNACTEVVSADDSDICNLGSINLSRLDTLGEFEEAVQLGTLFLLAGTEYSLVPYQRVAEVRVKNRRLGLGLMGIHEWLVKRGKPYGPDADLAQWMQAYTKSTEWANRYADQHGLTRPVATRSIAPNGTIGIIAETTTGIEPIFCVAYKRRYKSAMADGNDLVQYQYVIDPTAKRLIDAGADPDRIEDAYTLAYQVERRIAMQAWVQQYVDMAISSTTNLPYPITDPDEQRDFGEMLLDYLPKLRGITCYPDGSRGAQPLTASTYWDAVGKEGVVFEENEERCVGGLCGT